MPQNRGGSGRARGGKGAVAARLGLIKEGMEWKMEETKAALPQKASWWGRNWKWLIPVGCLSCILAFVGFVVLILFFVFGLIKSSDAYKQALSEARSNTAVTNALGSPIKEGFLVSGNINVSGASGNADLAIPISGPKGKATIYVEAVKSAGEWSFSKLVVRLEETNDNINLLDNSP
jgi:hypothetical protein